MAYVAGDKILDDQYNTFVNSSSSPFGYNHFAGTGSGVYGLGQTHIATRSVGTTIQASDWNSLFTGITNIANHTNDSITTRTAVSAGDTIAIKAAVAADLATLAASVAGGWVAGRYHKNRIPKIDFGAPKKSSETVRERSKLRKTTRTCF